MGRPESLLCFSFDVCSPVQAQSPALSTQAPARASGRAIVSFSSFIFSPHSLADSSYLPLLLLLQSEHTAHLVLSSPGHLGTKTREAPAALLSLRLPLLCRTHMDKASGREGETWPCLFLSLGPGQEGRKDQQGNTKGPGPSAPGLRLQLGC